MLAGDVPPLADGALVARAGVNPFRSKLGALNFLVLQWLFIRLQETVDDNDAHVRWDIIGFIVPMTGWWTNYTYLWRFS